MKTYEARQFNHLKGGLPGMSAVQLDAHFKLYEGYVNKLNEISEALDQMDPESGNYTYAEHSELKRRLPVALNGVLLHELYFENITSTESESPSEELEKAVEAHFSTVSRWRNDFMTAGSAGPGWVILSYIPKLDRLVNLLVHEHHVGHCAEQIPLLVMDMWEHAYFLDHKTDKQSYMDSFFDHIDWGRVNQRFESVCQLRDEETLIRAVG